MPRTWASIKPYRKTWKGYFVTKVRALRRPRGNRLVPPLVSVTAGDLHQIYLEQSGRCALTGRALTMDGWPDACSVDQIRHGEGYVLGNVRLITWQANATRGNTSDEHLVQFCRDVLMWRLRHVLPE